MLILLLITFQEAVVSQWPPAIYVSGEGHNTTSYYWPVDAAWNLEIHESGNKWNRYYDLPCELHGDGVQIDTLDVPSRFRVTALTPGIVTLTGVVYVDGEKRECQRTFEVVELPEIAVEITSLSVDARSFCLELRDTKTGIVLNPGDYEFRKMDYRLLDRKGVEKQTGTWMAGVGHHSFPVLYCAKRDRASKKATNYT